MQLQSLKARRAVKPIGVHAFVDVARVWLPQPLQPEQLHRVKRHCHGGANTLDNACLYHLLRQRLQLHQPAPEAWPASPSTTA